MSLRLKKRGEKALERALVVASPDSEKAEDGTLDGTECNANGTPGSPVAGEVS